ncbi:MAG TPA: DUF4142 domain-containing protein [Rhodanobacteraceae bacterium]|nr:DUF4142 domain-containing protein [Rhodanobacteraceae bacterium]
MRKWIFPISVLLVVPLVAFAAQHSKVSSQDGTWLIAAHQTNLAEIKSGDLAAESGHTEAVRKAGRMLTQDHSKLDAKLGPVAKQLGVKLPAKPNAEQRDEMKQFKSLSGLKFDKVWTHTEADGHVKAIEMTEREIHDGSLPKVKHLAESALPVLKKHLQTLHQTANFINGDH